MSLKLFFQYLYLNINFSQSISMKQKANTLNMAKECSYTPPTLSVIKAQLQQHYIRGKTSDDNTWITLVLIYPI